MDWPTFIVYCLLWIAVVQLGVRVGRVATHLARVESKLSFLAFVTVQQMEGKSPAEVRALLTTMGQKAQEEMTFAEIARKESPSWWRRLARRG